jgi:hypothetical protein
VAQAGRADAYEQLTVARALELEVRDLERA